MLSGSFYSLSFFFFNVGEMFLVLLKGVFTQYDVFVFSKHRTVEGFVFGLRKAFLYVSWFDVLNKNRDELVNECLEKGTEVVQAIANNLFNLPSTEDVEGPLIKLPPPTTRLPREKPVCSSLYLYICLCVWVWIYLGNVICNGLCSLWTHISSINNWLLISNMMCAFSYQRLNHLQNGNSLPKQEVSIFIIICRLDGVQGWFWELLAIANLIYHGWSLVFLLIMFWDIFQV